MIKSTSITCIYKQLHVIIVILTVADDTRWSRWQM